MSTMEAQAFLKQMQQVESLVEVIERAADPETRTAAQNLVRALLELHRSALTRVCEFLSQAGDSGRNILDACVRDELVGNVLLLHDLHPQDLETRVRAALDKVRPYLQSHGGSVELVKVGEGIVRIRMLGSCHGCASSAATLKSTIEQAIYDAAPDVMAIETEEPAGGAAPETLVQLGRLPGKNPAPQAPETEHVMHAISR